MKYLKVTWTHDFSDEPFELLSELDERRFEIRKIEYFRNGRVGYATSNMTLGDTRLGVVPVPEDQDIAKDPQFAIGHLDSIEFEAAWKRATSAL
jgi:hypothetical protein